MTSSWFILVPFWHAGHSVYWCNRRTKLFCQSSAIIAGFFKSSYFVYFYSNNYFFSWEKNKSNSRCAHSYECDGQQCLVSTLSVVLTRGQKRSGGEREHPLKTRSTAWIKYWQKWSWKNNIALHIVNTYKIQPLKTKVCPGRCFPTAAKVKALSCEGKDGLCLNVKCVTHFGLESAQVNDCSLNKFLLLS